MFKTFLLIVIIPIIANTITNDDGWIIRRYNLKSGLCNWSSNYLTYKQGQITSNEIVFDDIDKIQCDDRQKCISKCFALDWSLDKCCYDDKRCFVSYKNSMHYMYITEHLNLTANANTGTFFDMESLIVECVHKFNESLKVRSATQLGLTFITVFLLVIFY